MWISLFEKKKQNKKKTSSLCFIPIKRKKNIIGKYMNTQKEKTEITVIEKKEKEKENYFTFVINVFQGYLILTIFHRVNFH